MMDVVSYLPSETLLQVNNHVTLEQFPLDASSALGLGVKLHH